MTIGQRIKRRREELQMSQEELAKKIGYKSRSSINKIELNLYNLKQSKIKTIADALNTTPSYIMGWDELGKPENIQKIQSEIEIAKLIEQRYGTETLHLFSEWLTIAEDEREEISVLLSNYSKLDDLDRAGILGAIGKMIDKMLKDEKYSIQKESSTGKAI